tara:strand:+ start:503 stop:1126 length:624 start_codon:yes stop_codon:yes gene_type:complete
MNKMNETTEAKNASTPNQRRKLLSGIAAGVAVTSLSSKTAWAGSTGSATGCSVSGNLSGNLSNACDSTSAIISGKSPGYWSNVLNKSNHPHSRRVANLSGTDQNVAWSSVFDVGRSPFNGIGSSSDKIGDFIPHGKYNNASHNEINRHLVAAYMNAKMNYYPLASGATAESYVQGLYDLVHNGVYTQAKMSESIYSTYDTPYLSDND